MLVNEELLVLIKKDSTKGVIELCHKTLEYLSMLSDHASWDEQDYRILLEVFALFETLIDNEIITVETYVPEMLGQLREDCNAISTFVSSISKQYEILENQQSLASFRDKFKFEFGGQFFYEFSQGDVEKIQNLLNELRENIAKSELFEADHQRRLLSRLEKLQAELHKKVSDLDRFWGLIGDAGVVLGKLGEDAKPFVDRIKDIAGIVWNTQSRAEELPSGTKIPLLESDTAE